VNIFLCILLFIAVFYAAMKHRKVRKLEKLVKDDHAEFWFGISMKLSAELDRLERHPLFEGIDIPDVQDDPLGDIEIPDFLPESFDD
jgi:hypothetical protein